jgi:hypothetical protein
MNRYEVHAQDSLDDPIVNFFVEASSRESAARKAERVYPIVTSVEIVEK